MTPVNIPKGYQAVMPYLMLENAAKFKDFVTQVFHGKITSEHLQPDSEKIMHSEVDINGSIIMFCDSTEKYQPHPAHLFVYVANADETYKKALQCGGVSVTEPANLDYGRSCGVEDPCRNVWWITSVS